MSQTPIRNHDDIALGGNTVFRERDGIRTFVFRQLGEIPADVRRIATVAIQLDGSTPDLSPSPDLIRLIET